MNNDYLPVSEKLSKKTIQLISRRLPRRMSLIRLLGAIGLLLLIFGMAGGHVFALAASDTRMAIATPLEQSADQKYLSSQAMPVAETSQGAAFEPTNYCISCHSADDARLLEPTAWRGGIEREATSLCPAATRIHEELYYTERMLLAIERGLTSLGGENRLTTSSLGATIQSRQAAAVEGYARILDEPITSLDAFESETQTVRYQMGKLYTQINAIADNDKKFWVTLFGALVTLVVLGSLAWGIYNTRQIKSRGGISPTNPAEAPAAFKQLPNFVRRIPLGWIVVLLLIFGLFVLPLFRPVVAEVETPSAEEQAITTVHDTAKRLATAADRADSRAWMFSRIGMAGHSLETEQAEKAGFADATLEIALEATTQSKMNDLALWGESANVREVSVSDPALFETAGLIANQLNSTRSRAWAMALIGSEWAQVDPVRAEQIFAQAVAVTSGAQGFYRDLDLRRIAVEWARLNQERGIETAAQITDPAVKAWGLREIAGADIQQAGDAQLYAMAIEAARQVENPIQRAHALQEIGRLIGDPALFSEARASLEGQTGAALAYALSDLASASGDTALVDQIDPLYPAARVLALLNLGNTQQAWEASLLIDDPYEQGRAQAAIIAAGTKDNDSSNTADFSVLAQEIEIPALRERAMRDVIQMTGDASLVQLMSIAYYRVQALTALGQYPAAWEEAPTLKEPYPLVGLGSAWAKDDPASAAQVLDALKREADKAVVLRILAEATGDAEIFERALGMAQAARVRNDALAPAQASLDLFWIALTPEQAQAALEQAFEITERISIK